MSDQSVPSLSAQQVHVVRACCAMRVTYVGGSARLAHPCTSTSAVAYDDLQYGNCSLGMPPRRPDRDGEPRLEKGYRGMGVDIDDTDDRSRRASASRSPRTGQQLHQRARFSLGAYFGPPKRAWSG